MASEGDAHKAVAKRLFRLAHILRHFLASECVSTDRLCQAFGATPRTIQRDLKALRQAGFPIHEAGRGQHRLDKSLLKNLAVYDESELALIVALKDLTAHLGSPFARAADSVFNRLDDFTDQRPVFVKIDKPVWFSHRVMDRIIKAIQTTRCLSFPYHGHAATVEPYRIAYFDGVWYLIARDLKDRVIKKYALDKIGEAKILRTPFKAVPEGIDAMLEHSANIWFSGTRSLEVGIEVDAAWAGYFLRRSILPQQEIVARHADGSLSVRFLGSSLEEIIVCLKPWLPHVRIEKPAEARERLLAELKTWIDWQESGQP